MSGGARAAVAKELLVAVADGDERSLEIATALAHAVLDNETFRRARQLEELVRTRSPFALVRAVELAESLLIVTESVNMSAETSTSARSERK